MESSCAKSCSNAHILESFVSLKSQIQFINQTDFLANPAEILNYTGQTSILPLSETRQFAEAGNLSYIHL